MTGAAGREEEGVLEDLPLAGDGHQLVLQVELPTLSLVAVPVAVAALRVLTLSNLDHLNIIIIIITYIQNVVSWNCSTSLLLYKFLPCYGGLRKRNPKLMGKCRKYILIEYTCYWHTGVDSWFYSWPFLSKIKRTSSVAFRILSLCTLCWVGNPNIDIVFTISSANANALSLI